jgi:hypothetical protein
MKTIFAEDGKGTKPTPKYAVDRRKEMISGNPNYRKKS